MNAAVRGLILSTIAWGALAFGGVYPWAYWPLVAMGVLTLPLAWFTTVRLRVRLWPLVAPALAVGAAIGVQLVPLPLDLLERVSPNTVAALRVIDVAVVTGIATAHSLSLDTAATVSAGALYVAALCLALAVMRVCSDYGVKWLANGLLVCAVLMAFIGLIQKAVAPGGLVYGFWEPLMPASPFGPFINRNHFAGWMMMALPVGLGLLCAHVDKGMRGVKPEWRDRLVWFGSRSASEMLLVAGACVVMGLSLVVAFSRSGIAAFAVAVVIMGAVVVLRIDGSARRTVAMVYLVGLAVVVPGWVGMETLTGRFESGDWREFDTRVGAWADARRIAAMFPLAGTGLGTYGVATLLYQQHDLDQHYVQAHNDYLELAAEGGLLLMIPCVLLVGTFVWQVARRFGESGSVTSWWVRAGAVTGLLAIALQEVVDFSLQMPGNAMLCAVLCGIALHRAPMPVSKRA